MHDASNRTYLLLFGVLALVGLVADQVSKYAVFAQLYPADTEQDTRHVVLPGLFSLRTVYSYDTEMGDGTLSFLRTISGERLPHVNRGALFGWGNETDMNGFFSVVSVLAACFIIAWASRPTVARDRWLCLALGLILGGTLGNLYDRLVFSGVRDFLHCYYETHVWPDFNVADCCLVSGAGVLLAHSFLVSEPAPAQAKGDAAAAAAPVPVETTSPTPGT